MIGEAYRGLSKGAPSIPGWVVKAVSVFAFLSFFFLALQAATTKSPTFDESIHLLRSKVLWQSAKLTVQGEHPPLSHWIIGSLFFTEPTLPHLDPVPVLPVGESASVGGAFLWGFEIDVNRLLVIARLPIILVGLLLGALLVRWSRYLTGVLGAVVVAVLFAFSPNLLASTALATTDLVATAMFTAAIFATWFYWRRPSFWRFLLVGVLLGLALSSKLTLVLLLPITFFQGYINWFGLGPGEGKTKAIWYPGLVWAGTLLVAGMVLWSVFGFEVGRASGLPFPVPAATYVENFTQVQSHIGGGHSSFLLGELSFGWFHYFVVAYLFKTPAEVLILLALTIVYLLAEGRWRKTIFLWFPAVLVFGAASYSRLNIGFRHILPIVPLIWLLITFSVPIWLRNRGSLVVLGVLLGFYAFGTVRYEPNFLAYFNEFVGGPTQGYKYLGDANLDWGQDLRLVADYVAQSDIAPNIVALYGNGNPQYYGLEPPPIFDDSGNVIGLARANPAPGRYIISTSSLQGASEFEPHLYDWFRRQEANDEIGFTHLVYDVTASKPGSWIGHCADPETRLSNEQAEQLVGRSSLQHLFFDCRSSWLIPADNEPGWYVLPFEFEPEMMAGLFGDSFSLVYANAYSPKTPPYRIYYWDGKAPVETMLLNRSDGVTLADGTAIELPVRLGEEATFLGGWREENVWASAWQAGSEPGQFLSVKMHFYADEGLPAVGDGLGFASPYWAKGDIIIQYHDFGSQQDGYLETGLYDYNTLEGLKFETGDGSATSIRVVPES